MDNRKEPIGYCILDLRSAQMQGTQQVGIDYCHLMNWGHFYLTEQYIEFIISLNLVFDESVFSCCFYIIINLVAAKTSMAHSTQLKIS